MMAPESERAMWLVWSAEHQLWWRPNSQGYTDDVKQAGRYTFDKALSICDTRNSGNMYPKAVRQGVPDEIPVPAPEYFDRIRELDAPKEPTLTCSEVVERPPINGFCEKHQPNQAVQYAGYWVCSRNEDTEMLREVLGAFGWMKDKEAGWYLATDGDDCPKFYDFHDAIHAALDDYDRLREARERRVQELEEALRITSASIAKEMNRFDYEELDGSGAIITAEEVYKQSLEKAREQIRKGAKHES